MGCVTNRNDNNLGISFMKKQTDGKFCWEDVDEIVAAIHSGLKLSGTSRVICMLDSKDLHNIEGLFKNI